MKITIDQKTTEYPCIKITEDKCVVIFTENKTGFCLEHPRNPYFEYKERTDWCEIDFEPFKGSITLENS